MCLLGNAVQCLLPVVIRFVTVCLLGNVVYCLLPVVIRFVTVCLLGYVVLFITKNAELPLGLLLCVY